MGVLAMIPALYQYPSNAQLPPLMVQSGYGLFLGFLPVNIFNKLALIVFGIWGIAASRNPTTSLLKSINWSRWVFYVMTPLAILGIFPQASTLGGYAPLFGTQVWTHGIFALLGAYFGFSLTTKAKAENAPLKDSGRDIRAA